MLTKILTVSAAAISLVLIYFVIDLWQHQKKLDTLVFKEGEKSLQELKNGVDSVLSNVMQTSQRLARDIESAEGMSRDALEKILIERSRNLDEILGITIAFEPYAFDKNTQLYSPYFDRRQNKIIYIEDVYNYTDPELDTAQWYVQVRDTGSRWVEPYYARAAQALVSDYGVPFYYVSGPNKGKVRGTVTTTISLKGFTDIVQSLSLGKTGIGFVASKNGTIVAHPIRDYVGAKTLKEMQAQEKYPDMIKGYTEILQGKTGNKNFFDTEKKQACLFFYDQIPASNWGIAILLYRNDILGGDNHIKRKTIRISLTVSLLCLLLITLYFNRDFLSVLELWQLSSLASIVLFANIILIGFLQHRDTYNLEKINSPPVTDQAHLSKVIQKQNDLTQRHSSSALTVRPVGIHLEGIEFKDSYNLNISGRAWIKYQGELPEENKLGFYLPQMAPFAEASFFEESYRRTIQDHTLIVYEFRTTMRLNFNYSEYPFDKRHVAFELLPKQNNYTEIFIPDLEGYLYTSPAQKSGISSSIRIPGNQILESYFSYRYKVPSTRFGEPLSVDEKKPPSLYFNINIQRNLVTSFVTYLIPILICLTMMFILLCAAEKSTDPLAGGGIVQGLAAFFFVLVFSHIDLRKDLLTGELVYMEYFYFIAYLMIIICAINLIVFTRKQNNIFDYKNNIIVKTMFWPAFFCILLFVTLIKFF